MSAGYLPPVVVDVTGNIKDLLAKLEEAKKALEEFAATVTATKLSGDFTLLTAKIVEAKETDLSAWASLVTDTKLGANSSLLQSHLAAANAALAAWGREEANATAGLSMPWAQFQEINAALAAWGREKASAEADVDQDALDRALLSATAKLKAFSREVAQVKIGADTAPFWAEIAAMLAELKALQGAMESAADLKPFLSNLTQLRTQFNLLKTQLIHDEATIPVSLDTTKLKAELAAAQAQVQAAVQKAATIKVDADISANMVAAVAAAQKAIDNARAAIKVGADPDMGSVATAITEMKAAFALAGITVPVRPDVSATGFLASLAASLGGGGGASGILKSLGWGGGLFGMAAIGSAAGLAGFGAERLGTTLAGILGFTGAGLLGGGLLSLASLGTSFTGMATDLAGIGQAAGDIKNVYTATQNLQAAVAQYGRNSAQARAAQYAYNQQLQSFNPIARQAVVAAVSAIQGFQASFDKYTGLAEKLGAQIITAAVQGAEPLLPEIGAAAAKNMAIIKNALGPFLTWLDSSKPGGGLSDLTQIENIFTRNLPTALGALSGAFKALADTVTYLAPQTGKLTAWFNNFFGRLVTPTGLSASAMEHINKWVADWHVLTAFFKSIVKAIEAISAASAGTGKSIFTTLTSMIDQFTSWATSKKGHAELNTLMEAHKLQLDAILRLIGAVVGAFGKLELAVSPALVNALTSVIKAFTGLMNSKITVGSGITDAVKTLSRLGDLKINLSVSNLLKSLGHIIDGFIGLAKKIPSLTLGELTATAGGILLLSRRIPILGNSIKALLGIFTGKVTSLKDFWNVLTGKGSGLSGSAVQLNEAAAALKGAAASLKERGIGGGGGGGTAGGAAASDVEREVETGAEAAGGAALATKISKFLKPLGDLLTPEIAIPLAWSTIMYQLLTKPFNLNQPKGSPFGTLGDVTVKTLSINPQTLIVNPPKGGYVITPSGQLALYQQMIQEMGKNNLPPSVMRGLGLWQSGVKLKDVPLSDLNAYINDLMGGKTAAAVAELARMIGESVSPSLAKGIESGREQPTASMVRTAQATISALQATWQAHSPARVFVAEGQNAVLSLAAGITSERQAAISAAQAVARGVTSALYIPPYRPGAVGAAGAAAGAAAPISIHTEIHVTSTGVPSMTNNSDFSKQLKKALDEHDRKLVQSLRSGRV